MPTTSGRSKRLFPAALLVLFLVASGGLWQTARAGGGAPSGAAVPQATTIVSAPLPPLVDSSGVCHSANGCIANGLDVSHVGGWLSDNRTVTLVTTFAGTPADPSWTLPSGTQILLIRTDGTSYPNGQGWTCLTCGIPAANKAGVTAAFQAAKTFNDGERIFTGQSILDCSPFPLGSPDCTPSAIHVYPIRWNTAAGNTGAGTPLYNPVLSPDGLHVGWNVLQVPLQGSSGSSTVDPTNPDGTLALEDGYYGRLSFDANPTQGTPLVPRYDMTDVSALTGNFTVSALSVDPSNPSKLIFKPFGDIGELHGITGDAQSAVGMCWLHSNQPNACATNLTTGVSTPLTDYPAYTDTLAVSPDNNLTFAFESGATRQAFLMGLPGVPPVDQILSASGGATADFYRQGQHRFYQPYLYPNPIPAGFVPKQLNACVPPATESTANSVCDPNWGGFGYPAWSLDQTKIAYNQELVQSPDCFGTTPVDCPTYTAPGGYVYRLEIATLDTPPQPAPHVQPGPDTVPWATPYTSGPNPPLPRQVPPGVYTLAGAKAGSATVTVLGAAAPPGSAIPDTSAATTVGVTAVYNHYSDDGKNFINGTESVTNVGLVGPVTWHSALVDSDAKGNVIGTRVTTPGGFTLTLVSALEDRLVYAGEMVTTINGDVYLPPTPPWSTGTAVSTGA